MGELIVGLSVLLTLVFAGFWAGHRGFRAWIERPKHRFHDAVRDYDRVRHG
jgi:hypothetical protein